MDKAKLGELAKKNNQEKYNENSKNRLIKNIEKKFKTTMIGSLAVFEEYFGDLWGHNNSGGLTPEQEEFKHLWEAARTEVLNNGNTQLRIAQEEISEYTMTWNRYHIDFKLLKDNEEKDHD